MNSSNKVSTSTAAAISKGSSNSGGGGGVQYEEMSTRMDALLSEVSNLL